MSDIGERFPNLSAEKRALLEARLLKKATPSAKEPAIPRRDATQPVRLSFAQERLWFVEQMRPGTATYNIADNFRVRGRLNVTALEQSLGEIVRRHEALRTTFDVIDGEPVQVVHPPRPVKLPVTSLRDLSAAEREAELSRQVRERGSEPFALAAGPLFRCHLWELDEEDHALQLGMHHIISDGWSMDVLMRELGELYQGAVAGRTPELPELPIQYADFAVWQRDWFKGELFTRQLDFWKHQLSGAPELLQLPTDRPRPPTPTHQGGYISSVLPPELAAELQALSRREGATLFMTLLAALNVLLHRYTHQEDLVVGSPVANRTRVEVENVIGFFVNLLVMRSDLRGNPSFQQALRRVRETAMNAFANQDMPFERLVEELRPTRTASYNPLFQVVFVLQNASGQGQPLPGLTLEPFVLATDTAKFDLTFFASEQPDGLHLAIEYNAGLFDAATIRRILGHFEQLLKGIVADPARRISDLPVLTEKEREQLLVTWNDTRTEYPRDKCIHELFEEQVRQTPDATALVFEHLHLSYRELNERANRLAHRLREFGVGPDVFVAICADRSFDLVIGLLAILKAGGAYVPLDSDYPQERLEYMLADTKPPVLITHRRHAASLPAPAKQILLLEDELQNKSGPADNPRSRVAADHPAYAMFTSGSTGRPKGTIIPHRAVVRLVKNTNFASLGGNETFLQLAPVSFDASTLEIWGPLLNGGRLAIPPPDALSLEQIGEALQRFRVTTLWLTAGFFNVMVDERVKDLQGVKQLLTGGDVLSVPHIRQAFRNLPGTRLINGYGPTENTTFTCCHAITGGDLSRPSIPIGRPIANSQIYILDRHCQPVPVGIPGELYAGGDGLSLGYLNQPDLTSEKFVPNPFSDPPGAMLYRTGDLCRYLPDGTVEFLGRMDLQVKVRGFRIELEEIETVLLRHPAVREVVVIARDDTPGDKRLVACFVSRERPAPTATDLRHFLKDKIPDYMLPSIFVPMEKLPLSPNGKVDRANLPAPEDRTRPSQRTIVEPRNELERRLKEIWESVLNTRPVSVTDNFFDLGGHSLLGVRLFARIEKTFGIKLPLTSLFQAPTIELLARSLVQDPEDRPAESSSVVLVQPQGTRPPFFWVHALGGGDGGGLFRYHNLAMLLGTDQPSYGLRTPQDPFSRLEDMAACFIKDMRQVQPHGPYYLGGYCMAGVVAFEMARQLDAAGEKVGLVALIDSSAGNRGEGRVRFGPRSLGKFLMNLSQSLANAVKEGPAAFMARLRRQVIVRSKNLLRRITGDTRLGQIEIGDMLNMSDYPQEARKFAETHWRAYTRYVPRKYAGRLTVFKPRVRGLALVDPELVWRKLARGGLDVDVVPGTHGTIIEEPNVRVLVEHLKKHLDRAQRNGS